MYFSVTFALKHILATFSGTDWSKELFAYIASSIFHFFIFYYWFQASKTNEKYLSCGTRKIYFIWPKYYALQKQQKLLGGSLFEPGA